MSESSNSGASLSGTAPNDVDYHARLMAHLSYHRNRVASTEGCEFCRQEDQSQPWPVEKPASLEGTAAATTPNEKSVRHIATGDEVVLFAKLRDDLAYIDKHRSGDMSTARFEIEDVRTILELAEERFTARTPPVSPSHGPDNVMGKEILETGPGAEPCGKTVPKPNAVAANHSETPCEESPRTDAAQPASERQHSDATSPTRDSKLSASAATASTSSTTPFSDASLGEPVIDVGRLTALNVDLLVATLNDAARQVDETAESHEKELAAMLSRELRALASALPSLVAARQAEIAQEEVASLYDKNHKTRLEATWAKLVKYSETFENSHEMLGQIHVLVAARNFENIARYTEDRKKIEAIASSRIAQLEASLLSSQERITELESEIIDAAAELPGDPENYDNLAHHIRGERASLREQEPK